MPAVRDRLFIGEKTGRTNPDGVRAQLETSLTRLGCDSFDLYQAHGVTDLAELDRRAGAFEAILAARDEGLTRFVGITGHDLGTAAAQLEAVRRYDLDTVMLPVYPGALAVEQYRRDLDALLAECARRDVGVMAIKAVARRPWGRRADRRHDVVRAVDRGRPDRRRRPLHAVDSGRARVLHARRRRTAARRARSRRRRSGRRRTTSVDAQLAAAADEPIIFPLAQRTPRGR